MLIPPLTQIRLLAGVAKVELLDGTFEGRRCRTFDYSGCWVRTIGEWEKTYVPAQIQAIKSLQRKGAWVQGARTQADGLYEQDSVRLLFATKGKKPAKKAQTLEAAGVKTCGDLKALNDAEMIFIINNNKGLGKAGMVKLRTRVNEAKPGAYDGSSFVDHTCATDPYLSRYGAEGRDAALAAALRKAGQVCITELVIHMATETERVFKGTKHEKTWLFYHDALTQVGLGLGLGLGACRV